MSVAASAVPRPRCPASGRCCLFGWLVWCVFVSKWSCQCLTGPAFVYSLLIRFQWRTVQTPGKCSSLQLLLVHAASFLLFVCLLCFALLCFVLFCFVLFCCFLCFVLFFLILSCFLLCFVLFLFCCVFVFCFVFFLVLSCLVFLLCFVLFCFDLFCFVLSLSRLLVFKSVKRSFRLPHLPSPGQYTTQTMPMIKSSFARSASSACPAHQASSRDVGMGAVLVYLPLPRS